MKGVLFMAHKSRIHQIPVLLTGLFLLLAIFFRGAFAADVPDAGEELLNNGDFSGELNFNLYKESGGNAALSIDNGEFLVDISSVGRVSHAVQPYYDGFSLIRGVQYQMSFDARSSLPRDFFVRIQLNGGDYHAYFEEELHSIKKNSNFDVYGHLDYVVRYGASPDSPYDYGRHADLFDEIIKTLLDKEKAIELNTGGLKKGMKEFHPCEKLLRRYRELGGEIITIGSDAHQPVNVADGFDRACELLKECGFKYYCVFEKRTPEFRKL